MEFDEAAGEYNPVSAYISNSLKEGIKPEDIVQSILAKYDRDPTQFEEDWDGLMTQLKKANLLDND